MFQVCIFIFYSPDEGSDCKCAALFGSTELQIHLYRKYFYADDIAIKTKAKQFREANHVNLTIFPESYPAFAKWHLLPGEKIN